MRLLPLAFLLLGCRHGSNSADDVCSFEFDNDTTTTGSRTVGTTLADAEGVYQIHVALRWPEAGDPGTAPVAITLQGGWIHEGTPVGKDTPRTDPADGVVDVHFDLPDGGLSGGTNDRRGPLAASVVAEVLRWAAGETVDLGGCTLADRAPPADPSALYLIGVSNGGNLAVSTLTDETLTLPEVSGLITWETPIAASLVNVELGNSPTVYEPGACSWVEQTGLRCAFPADDLAVEDGGTSSTVCFDGDDDGGCSSDEDVRVNATESKETGNWVLSPEMRAAVEAQGLELDGFADEDEVEAWWAYRDASRRVGSLVERWPELPVMLIGSQDDHVLTDWSDHPHVYGWGEALQSSGAFWTRLNPGGEYLPPNTDENAPNAPLTLASSEGSLLTEEMETPLEDVLTAAVIELYTRRETGDW